jgi:hypothetical protein
MSSCGREQLEINLAQKQKKRLRPLYILQTVVYYYYKFVNKYDRDSNPQSTTLEASITPLMRFEIKQ